MAFDDKGRERRISLILLQYWNELRGDRVLPTKDEIDPGRLAEVWEHCFVVSCNSDAFAYTYLGSGIMQPYRDGVLDPETHVVVSEDPSRMAPSFMHVMETADPLLDEGECISLSDDIVRFRQCMMPLGTPKGEVEAIIGGAWYKVFKDT